MYRRLYQITLVVLQVALFVQLAPPLAQALRHGVAFGAFPEGFLAVIQLASAVATVSGGALALAFPVLALLRHRQRGVARFDGLPRWSVALAVVGGLLFLAGASLNSVVPLLPPENRMTAVLTARPVVNAGLALMAAGALCAETLRRGVGMPRRIIATRDSLPQRIEVTQPPELATRMA
jgi:hypothetical protein